MAQHGDVPGSGHTFGLAHQDENFTNANLNTCMDYTNLPESNQHPNTHDYDMLVSIYSHLDSTTTVAAQTANNTGTRVGNTPMSWGHLVDGSRSQGASTYVKDFRDGQQTVTHVIWAI